MAILNIQRVALILVIERNPQSFKIGALRLQCVQKASLFIGALRPAGVWPGLGCAEGPGHKYRHRYGVTQWGSTPAQGAEGQGFFLDKYTDSLTSISVVLESTVTFLLLERRPEGNDINSLSSCSWFFDCLQPNVGGPRAVPKAGGGTAVVTHLLPGWAAHQWSEDLVAIWSMARMTPCT